jgi:hypothetical protein
MTIQQHKKDYVHHFTKHNNGGDTITMQLNRRAKPLQMVGEIVTGIILVATLIVTGLGFLEIICKV